MSGLLAAIIGGIPTILGIIATVIAYKFNPRNIELEQKRKIYAELDGIYKKHDELRSDRDLALARNDTDALTRITAELISLRVRKNELFLRIGQSSGG